MSNYDDEEFDDKKNQMSAREMAKTFGETTVPKEKLLPNFSNMTKEEIEKWEKEEDDSTDIYRIAARVKNHARGGGGSLTPVGESLCNLFVHVLKDIYDFAEKLDDTKKEELKALLRNNEAFPSKVISLNRR